MNEKDKALQAPLINGIKFFLRYDPRIVSLTTASLTSDEVYEEPRTVNGINVNRPWILDDMEHPTVSNGGVTLMAQSRRFPKEMTMFDIAMEISAGHYFAVAFYKATQDDDGSNIVRFGTVSFEDLNSVLTQS